MVQLQKLNPKFKSNNLQLVGLSYDPVKTLSTFAKTKKIGFHLISDEGSKFIKSIGLEYKRGLPYPGTFVIGSDGIVKGKLFKEDHKKRHTPQETLDLAMKVVAKNKAKGSTTRKPEAVGSGAGK